jgi:dihydroorotate dehydrogenase
MLYQAVRPLLFHVDPETMHELAVRLLSVIEALPALARTPPSHPALERRLWGLRFANPVGLAAGFDKNAKLPHVWQCFGFGFAELGTVTARPQPGNPRPRLFRLPDESALINRLGFNNDGAEAVAARLRERLAARPVAIPLGINIGKSAATALADAPDDYRQSYRLLAELADYVTVNVSSPNTAGLRDLQAAASLAAIVDAIRSAPLPGGGAHPPLLVKVAPDLDDEQLRDIVDLALQHGIDGLIATNTTIRRDMLAAGAAGAAQAGGLSGRPLAARSTAVVRTLRAMTGGRIPIIGVGGIFDADDAFAKICAGADLVQMYTGFIYGGPTAPRRVAAGLLRRLEESGFASVAAAVGSGDRRG